MRADSMTRIAGALLIVTGLWFIWWCTGVVVSDSEHLGSVVWHAEERGRWEERMRQSSLSPSERDLWLEELRDLQSTGILGFRLLEKSLVRLGLSGGLLALAGFVLWNLGSRKPNETTDRTRLDPARKLGETPLA